MSRTTTKMHFRENCVLVFQVVSLCQAVAVCTLIALLYASRAVYNILAVSPIHLPSFNFGWINVSDQVCI